jgi:putative transposase
MSDLFWVLEARKHRITSYYPLSHGIPRVDDRHILSGIMSPLPSYSGSINVS